MHEKFSNIQSLQFKAMPQGVDTSTRMLQNVIICEVGEAEGHGVYVEDDFNDLVVELAGEKGFKCNMGHNYNNMGLQLGRISNVRKEKGKTLADLSIYENADSSPKFPNMGTWFMNQASEDASSVNLSLKFKPSYYQYDKKGERYNIEYSEFGWPTNYNKKEKLFALPTSIYSIDVVDDGALTSTLYHSDREESFVIRAFKNIFGLTKEPQKFSTMTNVNPDNVVVQGAQDAASDFNSAAELSQIKAEFASYKDSNSKEIESLKGIVKQQEAEIEEFKKLQATQDTKLEFVSGTKEPEDAVFAAYYAEIPDSKKKPN